MSATKERELIAKILDKVADRLRAKTKSIRDWGWDPSATEESRAAAAAHDAMNEGVRTTLNEVADALSEEAEELVTSRETGRTR